MRRQSGVAVFIESGAALATGLLIGVTAMPAAAMDQQDLQRLLQEGSCQSCDFSGGDMAGIRLHGSNLQGSTLEGTNLRGARIVEADFSNADLSDADLSGALVQDTTLSGATMEGTVLNGTVFDGADLTNVQGLNQLQLDAACDDRRANVSALSVGLTLAPCR